MDVTSVGDCILHTAGRTVLTEIKPHVKAKGDWGTGIDR